MKSTKFQLLKTYLAIQTIVLGAIPFAAHASIDSDMADMFNSMGAVSTVQGSGAYRTQSADVYMGGSAKARWGIKPAPDIANLQLPYMKAGCGGIDLFGGSFSFANKEQFTQFVSNLANNAVGVAFEIGINALDPLIGDSISKIRDLVTKVNSQAMDSCQAAQSLVSGVAGAVGEAVNGSCQAKTLNDNTTTDASDSKWYCANDYNLMNERLKNRLKDEQTNGNGPNKNSIDYTGGNYTLRLMRNMSLTNEEKKWLLSILGTVSVAEPVSGQSAISEPVAIDATIKDVSNLLGSDANGALTSSTVKVDLIVCKDAANAENYEWLKATKCEIQLENVSNIRKQVEDRIKVLATSMKLGQKPTNAASVLALLDNTSEPILLMLLQDAYVSKSAGGANASYKNYMTEALYDLVAYDFAWGLMNNFARVASKGMNNASLRSTIEKDQFEKGLANLNRLKESLLSGRDKKRANVLAQIETNQKILEVKENALANLGITKAIRLGKQMAASR